MKSENTYVVDSEYDGAFVGTMCEIGEWASDNSVNLFNCAFYELGREVGVKLAVVD